MLRYDGLYACIADSYTSYLRFFEDGVVKNMSAEASPNQAFRWLDEGGTSVSTGRYTINDNEIEFSTTSSAGTVDFEEQIQDNHLELHSYSHINGNKGSERFRFIEIIQARIKGRTIEIGTHKNVGSLRQALLESGVQIWRSAGNILYKTPLSKSKQSLDLVVLFVKELGFPQGAQLKDIYDATGNQGLDKCPAEAALQYPLQCGDDLKEKDSLYFAMEPIEDSSGDMLMYNLFHDVGKLWLNVSRAQPSGHWGPNTPFVFVRRE